MISILVVDDLTMIRELLRTALEREGYRVRVASDREEALTQMRHERPRVILLDLNLATDGSKLLQQIRADDSLRGLPVIVISEVRTREEVLAAIDLGVSDFMLKSQFSLRDLCRRVQRVVAAPQKSRRAGTREASAPPSEPPSQTVEHKVPVTAVAPSPSPGADASEARRIEDPLEALKSLTPIVSRSEITEFLDSIGEIKAMSPAVMQVINLTNNPNCSLDKVVKAVRNDHAIALKLLKLANSAVYNRGEPIDSVAKAVTRIGLDNIRTAVLNLSVVENFSNEQAADLIDFGRFWEHSIGCGLIASKIATTLQPDLADSAFTMGLLHDVGRMVLLEHDTERYRMVIETARTQGLPLDLVEKRLMLVSHADMMDRVLRSWNFPKSLIDPIVFHHLSMGNIRQMARKQLTETAILALANRLSKALLLGDSGNATLYSTEEFFEALRLPADFIGDLEASIHDETDEVKFAMLASSGGKNWSTGRDLARGKLKSAFNPIFHSMTPRVDAFRMVCDNLREGAEETRPNVAVVHLRHQREVVPVTEGLERLEREAQVANLPVIILSPAGKLELERRIMDARRTHLLPIPITLDRFVDAVNDCLAHTAAVRSESDAASEGLSDSNAPPTAAAA